MSAHLGHEISFDASADLTDAEYADLVERLKKHIVLGDVFQIVPSRTFSADCPDAQAAYGDRLTRFRRHVVLIRPSVICIVDDLQSPEPAEFQWLLHAGERLRLDEDRQTLISHREDVEMEVQLLTPGGLAFSQTDTWPLAPKTGFPTASKREPTKLWHFTATTRRPATARRMSAASCSGSVSDARSVAGSSSAPDRCSNTDPLHCLVPACRSDVLPGPTLRYGTR